jgi:hypothetical protein
MGGTGDFRHLAYSVIWELCIEGLRNYDSFVEL